MVPSLVLFIFGAGLAALEAAPLIFSTIPYSKVAINKLIGGEFMMNLPKNVSFAKKAAGRIVKRQIGIFDITSPFNQQPTTTYYYNLQQPTTVDVASLIYDYGELNMGFKWPGGIVPFKFSSEFSLQAREKIRTVVEEFKKYTCIRWVAYDPSRHFHYLSIETSTGICRSEVGCQPGKRKMVLDERGCMNNNGGVLMHEMMHILGFWHEHSRPDRDSYVTINWDNIQADHRHEFDMAPQMQSYGVPYDYNSILHYKHNTFTKNGASTITPTDPSLLFSIGQREGFTTGDIKKINSMYQCHLSVEQRNALYPAEAHAMAQYTCNRILGVSC